ncbi:hypothetical protein CPY51_07695 [Rhizobium tubonense]|jgi:hypothetical protein|uniref:Uncharacterized protein n=1 Tax=Rhizobium tubonense TaxID=484088 RepID=A0A2W4CRY4_9HYPH|nr:hypothetical protein CPY51_07695 [Rhizobium tubonense]
MVRETINTRDATTTSGNTVTIESEATGIANGGIGIGVIPGIGIDTTTGTETAITTAAAV